MTKIKITVSNGMKYYFYHDGDIEDYVRYTPLDSGFISCETKRGKKALVRGEAIVSFEEVKEEGES